MTIKEIAQLAGVSISTVSKIVNDKASTISPSTKERVLKIVKEYNYTPYGMVKDTSNARTFLLGVLLRTFRMGIMYFYLTVKMISIWNYAISLPSARKN